MQPFFAHYATEGRPIPLDELLAAREQRALLQQQCLTQYRQTVLSVTQLAVGAVKKNALLDAIFAKCLENVTACLAELAVAPLAEFIRPLETGNEAIFVLPIDAVRLKQAMIALEDSSPLARLWDLDVIAPTSELLSRRELGFSPRPCLLCADDAKLCARSRRHSADDIIAEMQQRLFAEQIGEWVNRALLQEALLTPKPSLVDQANSGSHRDMDLASFQRSAAALRPFWAAFVRQGMATAAQDDLQILAKIRPLGLQAERAMLNATGEVNTHKGAIFAFGLVCTALGRLWQQRATLSVAQICQQVAAFTQGITAELQHYPTHLPETAGVKLFRQFGLTGARGEAESGFPLVQQLLPTFMNDLSASGDWDWAALRLLLQLMAHNQDTNVAHRGGLAGLQFVQQQAQQILAENCKKSEFCDRLQQFDQACIARNLSAGGSADLLALSFFFYFLTSSL